MDLEISPPTGGPSAGDIRELNERKRLAEGTLADPQLASALDDLGRVYLFLGLYAQWSDNRRVRHYDSKSLHDWLEAWVEARGWHAKALFVRLHGATWRCETTAAAEKAQDTALPPGENVLTVTGLKDVAAIDAAGRPVFRSPPRPRSGK
jgi:hypothetical protein